MASDPQQLWDDENNWSGGMYSCAEDPRLFVPGRAPTLITVNNAHGRAWIVLIALMAAIAVPAVILSRLRVATWIQLVAPMVGVLVAALVMWRLSRLPD